MGAADLNSGPHAYMAGTVLTALSAPWEVVSKSGFTQMTLSRTPSHTPSLVLPSSLLVTSSLDPAPGPANVNSAIRHLWDSVPSPRVFGTGAYRP